MIPTSLKLFILITATSLSTQRLAPLINSVRSSTLVTLTMISFVHFFMVTYDTLFFHKAIFAASFLGMADSKKISPSSLTLGSLLLSLLIQTTWAQESQLGGTLGLCAFMACFILSFSQNLLAKSNS